MEDKETKAVTPGQAVKLYESIITAGEESWHKWVRLGTWVKERRAIAVSKAHGTRGPTYAAQLEKAMGAFHPVFKRLSDNGTISYIDKCLAQLELVTAFRNRISEDQRPSTPSGVWREFEASLSSTTDFQSAEDEVAEEDAKEKGGKRKAHGKEGHNREKALMAEIELLREKLDEQRLSIYPDANAERIWRNLVEVLGHGRETGELAIKTAEKLLAIGRRITDDGADEAPRSGLMIDVTPNAEPTAAETLKKIGEELTESLFGKPKKGGK